MHSKKVIDKIVSYFFKSNIKKASFIRGDRIKDGSGKAINFNDVAGLHEAKVELMEFVDFLQRPQKYKVTKQSLDNRHQVKVN